MPRQSSIADWWAPTIRLAKWQPSENPACYWLTPWRCCQTTIGRLSSCVTSKACRSPTLPRRWSDRSTAWKNCGCGPWRGCGGKCEIRMIDDPALIPRSQDTTSDFTDDSPILDAVKEYLAILEAG